MRSYKFQKRIVKYSITTRARNVLIKFIHSLMKYEKNVFLEYSVLQKIHRGVCENVSFV